MASRGDVGFRKGFGFVTTEMNSCAHGHGTAHGKRPSAKDRTALVATP